MLAEAPAGHSLRRRIDGDPFLAGEGGVAQTPAWQRTGLKAWKRAAADRALA